MKILPFVVRIKTVDCPTKFNLTKQILSHCEGLIMAKAERIPEEQINTFLAKVPLWKRNGNMIVRLYEFPTFLAAIGFMNAVAICAEVAQHHPDMLVYSWNKVKISIATHEKGGLTEQDFALAAQIDAIQA
ncbi:MAG: 4a-hydroxytetrahydrobiopterin dehydratase [Candidatus Kapabacteria bacterium]|jgi:4a-hydroxytetrahydrobiopterin dehydratase|nr:4a-hydroxytetrahydrobiopterin dehydratase [Candidatus Kapabacteria bacterium]